MLIVIIFMTTLRYEEEAPHEDEAPQKETTQSIPHKPRNLRATSDDLLDWVDSMALSMEERRQD